MTMQDRMGRASRAEAALMEPSGLMVVTLNDLVALASDLRSQLKQAHWNTVGPNFIALHRLFDEQATIVLAHVDLYAERARALRGVARGTVRVAASPGVAARRDWARRAVVAGSRRSAPGAVRALRPAADRGDPRGGRGGGPDDAGPVHRGAA